jgi:sugar lactone lactonase YvrE
MIALARDGDLALTLAQRIAGAKISTQRPHLGGLAEGIAFSPDGRYLYVGNFVDGDIDILRVDGDTLTKVANLALPGHPASMRGSTP